MKKSSILLLTLLGTGTTMAQQKQDKANFIEHKNPFYDQIEQALDQKEPKASTVKSFKMDQSGVVAPAFEDFKTAWCQKPTSQGRTGTCWCFSTTSFYESEVFRITGKGVDLSELYTVYFEYVEKAREYVKTRGKSHFGEGSQTNAVARMMATHGLVPHSAYEGNALARPYHDHEGMFLEMETYLKSVKASHAWNEQQVLSTITSILNHYLGTPPKEVVVEGKKMSPQSYMKDFLKIDPNNYVNFMSLMQSPYYTKAEYVAPDNYWKSTDYNNVPLQDFTTLVKQALKAGYTISIGGDVSESGYNSDNDLALVPSYDIPSAYIDEHARQMRFTNGSTTDDHAIHLIGSTEKDGVTWYLIKDSGSGGFNGNLKGYYRYHEDYLKLKIMTLTLHKDAALELLKKIK